jgi:hypothetical protein
MTQDKFWFEVGRSLTKEGSQLRVGQAAYNLLHENRPDLSFKIIGTHLDPFYDNSKLGAFANFIRKNW